MSRPVLSHTYHDNPTGSELDMPALHALHKRFTNLLLDFSKSSTDLFRILYTQPSTSSVVTNSSIPQARHCRTLFVLDSSFNPPSRAHLGVAKSAVLASFKPTSSSTLSPSPSSDRHTDPEGTHDLPEERDRQRRRGKRRLLFLLATENADKAPKPAGFADRLVMMVLMARSLQRQLTEAISATDHPQADDSDNEIDIDIDIAVTKKPYFIDKAAAIDSSHIYDSLGSSSGGGGGGGSGDGDQYEQVHLVGFDTLTRIFDQKYYGDAGLSVLAPFLDKHRVRAMLRTGEDGKYGDRGLQERWLEELAEKKEDGFRREWLEKVELVDDGGAQVEGVSSTRVREAVKRGDSGLVKELVGEEVARWIGERGLYAEIDHEGRERL